jgi:oxygen-independent coproporphyrinogen-3 oxidase
VDDLALYIHWPFCLAKCPYCDFNSHVRERMPAARFAAALRRELAEEAAALGPRRLTSIFFGGGTPSLMEPEDVGALIADATTLFTAGDELEITLEANPTSVEAARLRAFRDAGVNRVSLGVQALDDAALRFLGRQHSAAQALDALAQARAVFPRASFDLIYARPGQTEAAWRAELRRALGFAHDHLSLYQLTIEPGTAFATRHARGEFRIPDGDEAARLYLATAEEAARAGLTGYEISNYAAPGAESQHNLAYWRYADYAGIGPGAHGRITRDGTVFATRRHRAPEEWATRVERTGSGLTDAAELDAPTRAREALLMGLRLAEGIEPARFHARTGTALHAALDTAMLTACMNEGYVEWTDAGRLRATDDGRLRLDALLPVLVR